LFVSHYGHAHILDIKTLFREYHTQPTSCLYLIMSMQIHYIYSDIYLNNKMYSSSPTSYFYPLKTLWSIIKVSRHCSGYKIRYVFQTVHMCHCQLSLTLTTMPTRTTDKQTPTQVYIYIYHVIYLIECDICHMWAKLGANSMCVSATTDPRFEEKQAHHFENAQ
jgi:hypothetical protein